MKSIVNIVVVISLVVFFSNQLKAQKQSDDRLAAQYYDNKEYDKAVIFYEKLFDKTHSSAYYVRLLTCFTELKEYNNAEKLIKREIKNFPYQLEFWTDLGN